MIPVSVRDLAASLGWVLAADQPTDAVGDAVIGGVVTDSRSVGAGDLYVARRGASLDGAQFAGAAMAAGAVAVVATQPLRGIPTIVVEDPDVALTRIATWVRDQARADVVAITGSVGKTTTKDLVAGALSGALRVVAATGSYNNEVGVPLTVARTGPDTQVLVAELGARGIGQVAELARWVRPDVAVVTAVAGVHLELFGSLDAIAVAKGELVEALPPDGTAVLNGDDPRVAAMASRTTARVLTVSATGRARADLVADDIRLDGRAHAHFTAVTPWGQFPVTLPVAGRHHVTNALLALGVAGVLGVDGADAAARLGSAVVSTGRARVMDHAGLTIVDDSYNANPTSTLAALDTVAAMDVLGRRLGVLGVMAEIGVDHVAEHERVGRRAADVLDGLVVVGADAVGLALGARAAGLSQVVQVADAAAAVDALRGLHPTRGDAVLVKASRVAALESVVAALAPAPDTPALDTPAPDPARAAAGDGSDGQVDA